MVRVWVLVSVTLLACGGGPKRVHKPGEAYLDKIVIEGNHAIESDTLIHGLLLERRAEAGRAVDEYQLVLDEQRIVGAYQRLGFLSVEVRSRVDHKGDADTVVFTVTEGARATVTVELDGLPSDVPLAKARALVPLADGGPFDYAGYDGAKATLLLLVENAGYAHAQLDAGVIADRTHAKVIARYVFDAGPHCTFGPVTVTGADGSLADAIRVRLETHEGQPYSTDAIAQTQRALYAMNRFSTVHVDIDQKTDATVVPVHVAVTVGNRHEARAGGGFGLDSINYSIRARAQYSVVGWPFQLSTLSLDAKPEYTLLRVSCHWYKPWTCQSEPRVRLIATLTQQDFLLPKVVGEIEGGLDFLTIEAYTILGVHARLGLSTPLWTPRIQARIGWLVGEYYFRDFSPALDPASEAGLGINNAERLGNFSQTLVVDLRDRPIEPRYGGYADLRITEGTRYAGGAFEYVQVTPEVRLFAPLGPVTLGSRLRVGEIIGDVPPTERYYGGGASSDRGYPTRQLSPIATNPATGDSVIIGGAGLIETGVEARIRVGEIKGYDLGTVAFLDGGDVEDSVSALSFSRLHWAVGLGLRWFFLPVGPARLDIAYRLGTDDPAQPVLSRWQWFLSVGEAY
jgi:outer membrane protein assembly factor BamA